MDRPLPATFGNIPISEIFSEATYVSIFTYHDGSLHTSWSFLPPFFAAGTVVLAIPVVPGMGLTGIKTTEGTLPLPLEGEQVTSAEGSSGPKPLNQGHSIVMAPMFESSLILLVMPMQTESAIELALAKAECCQELQPTARKLPEDGGTVTG
ncbi:hypothetical protein EV359DRAFT_63183 [Lentinula novae-zelandiae]|nr:hypothetical protein EV359DRAFT_63183 [Lentinula novae-zelandiae]